MGLIFWESCAVVHRSQYFKLINFIPKVFFLLIKSATIVFVLLLLVACYNKIICLFFKALQGQQLTAELNEILAHDIVDFEGMWKRKLTYQSFELVECLPQALQEQLMLEYIIFVCNVDYIMSNI